MKKLILGAVALMALASVSCSDKNAKTDDNSVGKALSDSVSMYYGKTVGSYVLADYMRFGADNKEGRSKEDILKGIRMVIGSKPSEGTLMGLQIGAQLMNELAQIREQGVDIDNETVFRYFKEAFDADSLDMLTLQENSATLNALIARVQAKAEERQAAAQAEAPDAQDNAAAGQTYVNTLKEQDPEIKTSDSGLSYKIINKGDDTPLTDNSMVEVNYVGKHIDGRVFDQNPEGQPATFSPAGLIPGFSEGLKMLGKGGRAVLYIPGNLAYGPQGVPQAEIGPNEMLVFEVEVVDIK